ncbi:MAG: hypothetical protein LBL04_01835 [Bacteroidales bacterium]|jgi:hypothetical protein|nr:hypothetical protein [Bacteroidales bacterium]
MENSQVKLPKATYFDSRIDCRITNPAMFRAAIQLPLNGAAMLPLNRPVYVSLRIRPDRVGRPVRVYNSAAVRVKTVCSAAFVMPSPSLNTVKLPTCGEIASAKLPLNGAAYSAYRGKQPDGYERNDFNEIKKGERK